MQSKYQIGANSVIPIGAAFQNTQSIESTALLEELIPKYQYLIDILSEIAKMELPMSTVQQEICKILALNALKKCAEDN